MSGQKHPDTEEIASLQAGFVSGSRARRLAAHVAGCARCAAVSDQFGAVSSMLASVPSAALPEAFERQISAAIATEASARAAGVGTADASPAHATPADRVKPSARPARSRGLRGYTLRPGIALIPVAACLLVGFGYLLSHTGSSSSSSSAGSGVAASAPTPVNAAASAQASASGPAPAAAPERSRPLAFTVVRSGTRYRASTLAAQVRGELRALKFSVKVPVPSAAPSSYNTSTGSSAAGGGTAPPQPLVGCVLQVTGGTTPSLVDRAYYQDKPAYVIVVPDKAWVVGVGCTASDTDVITSAALTTAP